MIAELDPYKLPEDDIVELNRIFEIEDIDQEGIIKIGTALINLLVAKNKDYGSSAWKPPILAPHMSIRSAIMVRMSDKIARLENLLDADAGGQVSSETVAATLLDLAGYIILLYAAPQQ